MFPASNLLSRRLEYQVELSPLRVVRTVPSGHAVKQPMALTRAYDEHEVSGDIRRIYSEIRATFDLPFVPTIFKTLAGEPEYLRMMWRDLAPVAASREFQTAAMALDEFVRSKAIHGAWRFSNQERALAEQNIAAADMPVLAGVVGIFARATPRIALFTRLMRSGYAGGQKGRVTAAKHDPALSRMVSLHIPSEKDAGLRVWLLYADIRRTLQTKQVMGLFRALSPFPGYLASSWVEAKKILHDGSFIEARDGIAVRTSALTVGLPVRDHREASAKSISQDRWKEISQTVDTYSRVLPQIALLSAVWRRSFFDQASRTAA